MGEAFGDTRDPFAAVGFDPSAELLWLRANVANGGNREAFEDTHRKRFPMCGQNC